MDTTCPNCGCLLIVESENRWIKVTGIVGSVIEHKEHSDEVPTETESEREPEPDPSLVAGEMVRFARGTFAGFVGQIVSIDRARQKAIVKISIFGRDTPVEQDLTDLVRLP